MNFKFLLGFFKGGNVFETIAKLLTFGGGVLASTDENNTGTDDLIADVLVSAGDGLTAYSKKDYNEAGNIIEGIISCLKTLQQRLKESGQIEPNPQ